MAGSAEDARLEEWRQSLESGLCQALRQSLREWSQSQDLYIHKAVFAAMRQLQPSEAAALNAAMRQQQPSPEASKESEIVLQSAVIKLQSVEDTKKSGIENKNDLPKPMGMSNGESSSWVPPEPPGMPDHIEEQPNSPGCAFEPKYSMTSPDSDATDVRQKRSSRHSMKQNMFCTIDSEQEAQKEFSEKLRRMSTGRFGSSAERPRSAASAHSVESNDTLPSKLEDHLEEAEGECSKQLYHSDGEPLSRTYSRFLEKDAKTMLAVKRVVENKRFDFVISMFIFINASVIGIQTDYMVKNATSQVPVSFRVFDLIFCAVFTVEVVLRLFAFRLAFFLQTAWRWNIFDMTLVILQLMEEVIQLASGDEGQGSNAMPGDVGFLRVIRILRLLRVLRVVRMMRFVKELQSLVISIGGSLRNLAWTLVLIVLMMYVVGVYFTQLIADHAANNPETFRNSMLESHFGSLLRSLLSLFQAMTGGVDWDNLAEPFIRDISPFMGFVFAVYIAFAVLAMMNVVTGVFVETALQTANAEKDNDLIQQIGKVFMHDVEPGSKIVWEEFSAKLELPQVKNAMKNIDLSAKDAQGLFNLLDIDQSGEVFAEEFLMGCLRLKGNAKAVDLTTMMYNSKRMAHQQRERMDGIKQDLRDILRTVGGRPSSE